MLSIYSNRATNYPQATNVSSTNLFHSFTLLLKFGITNVSSSTMNLFVSTKPNGEPVATPGTLCYVRTSQMICTANLLIGFEMIRLAS